MRKQYHYWRGDAWDVERLLELSATLPVHEVRVTDLADLDRPYWYDGSSDDATVRSIVAHMRLVQDVDLGYPIILSADGRVMDGMHRVARSLLENRATIPAVRFEADPPPDFRNCRLDDLPYD